MRKDKKLHLLIIIIVLKISFISSYITLPFYFSLKGNEGENTNFDSEPKNYFKYYMQNTIYTKIKVNDQIVNFRLSMDTFTTYISDKIYNPENIDNKEVKIDKNYTLNYINLNKVKMVNESFYFENIGNNSNQKELKIFNNYTFFQVNKYTNDTIDKEDAIIGLNRVKGAPYIVLKEDSDHWGCKYEENTNLIGQLKSRKIINSTLFSIKYDNSKEEGEVIIGEFPHNYAPKLFTEKNLYYNKVTCYTCPPFNYYSKFTEMFYKNQTLSTIKTFQINIDHGFIEAPLSEKKYFDSFFEEYKDFCKEENIDNVYVFYCKKEAIKNFGPIVFYFENREIYKIGLLNAFNLELDYNDLFKNNGNNKNLYYFQIIFKKNEDWIFGKPLFKKYRLVFDQNNKMYGIYENIKNAENVNKKSFKKSFSIIIVLVIIIAVLGIISIVEGYLLISKKCYQQRNKRANELNDEYEYKLNNDKNNDDSNPINS
jgi:flagellar basal body-associated protein FliL